MLQLPALELEVGLVVGYSQAGLHEGGKYMRRVESVESSWRGGVG